MGGGVYKGKYIRTGKDNHHAEYKRIKRKESIRDKESAGCFAHQGIYINRSTCQQTRDFQAGYSLFVALFLCPCLPDSLILPGVYFYDSIQKKKRDSEKKQSR